MLSQVLAADPLPDVIVCAQGHVLDNPAPRDLDEVRAYLRMGIGLVLRQTQRCHPRLAAIADEFTQYFSGSVEVQIFVTPAQTHGFGWHYDADHVFIAQTVGRKDYYFRENTVERDGPFPPADFSAYRNETSPFQTATLVAGDFLYLPPRWWNMAICREASLAIAVGVAPAVTDAVS